LLVATAKSSAGAGVPPPVCACTSHAAAVSEPIRHDLKGGKLKAFERGRLKRSKKTFRAWSNSSEKKIS
jgi:hypothetical protein